MKSQFADYFEKIFSFDLNPAFCKTYVAVVFVYICVKLIYGKRITLVY